MRRRMTIVMTLTLLLIAAGAVAESRTKLTPPANAPVKVAILMTDGATVIDFAGPWEVFSDVTLPGDRDGFELMTVGASRSPVRASGGLMVVPDWTFDDAPIPDVVLVGAQRGAPGLIEWLKKVDGQKKLVLSVCTGAFKLGAAGLLDGKAATTHHNFFDKFARQYPNVKLQKGKRYVQSDDQTFTAGGLSSGIDLALHVVDLYYGREVAQQTATYMEYEGTGWKR
jgi:transcriptional regulator GlxA family with amidase domain